MTTRDSLWFGALLLALFTRCSFGISRDEVIDEAADAARDVMRPLFEEVQELKSDVRDLQEQLIRCNCE